MALPKFNQVLIYKSDIDLIIRFAYQKEQREYKWTSEYNNAL